MHLYKKIVHLIENWKPKRKYYSENKYQNDLRAYLKSELNTSENGFPNKKINIKTNKEKELCDMIVDHRVGIELKIIKKDIPKAKNNRLFDEMLKKRESHKEGIIIVLVGKESPEAKNEFKKRTYKLGSLARIISPIKHFMRSSYQVKFIDKTHK